MAKQTKDVKDIDFEGEDNEEIVFVGYKNKKLIQKHPYDKSGYGCMLGDHSVQNVDDKKIYRHFYACDKNGNKQSTDTECPRGLLHLEKMIILRFC
jgi:hypothetical protein